MIPLDPVKFDFHPTDGCTLFLKWFQWSCRGIWKIMNQQQSVSLHVQVLCASVKFWNRNLPQAQQRAGTKRYSGQAYFSVISISVSTDGILYPCSMTLTSSIFLDGKVKVEKSFSHNRVILRTILRYWFYCIRQLESILSITCIQIDTLKYSWW